MSPFVGTRLLASCAFAGALSAIVISPCHAASEPPAVAVPSGPDTAPPPRSVVGRETPAPSEGALVFTSIPAGCNVSFRRATVDTKGVEIAFGRIPPGTYPLVATRQNVTLRAMVSIYAKETTIVQADFVAAKVRQSLAKGE